SCSWVPARAPCGRLAGMTMFLQKRAAIQRCHPGRAQREPGPLNTGIAWSRRIRRRLRFRELPDRCESRSGREVRASFGGAAGRGRLREGAGKGSTVSYTTILFEASAGVATITLDRPARLNALTNTMFRELGDAL